MTSYKKAFTVVSILALIVSILFGYMVFETPERASAAADCTVGTVYTARAGTTNLVTNLTSAETQLTYDTEVDTSTDVVRQAGNQAFRLQQNGRYMIITSTGMNYADIGNNFRHEVRTNVKVGGTNLNSTYGMASSYGRDAGNADEGNAVTVSYIDHTVVGGAGDDIEIFIQNFGDVTNSLADQFANKSGIQIICMPDSDYLQVNRSSDVVGTARSLTNGVSDPVGWDTVTWETQDVETNTAVIEWTSGTDVTLKETGKYMVIQSFHGGSGGASNRRTGVINRLMLNSTEVKSSRQLSFIRGYNGDSTDDAWGHNVVVVDATANDTLSMDWTSGSNGSVSPRLYDAGLTVVRLPDTGSYLSAHNSANRAGETQGVYPLNTEDFDDDGLHDNVTNNSRLTMVNDDNWVFFFNWFDRSGVDGNRVTNQFRPFKNGVEVQYGSGLSYSRGDQGAYDVFASGRMSAIATGDYVATDYLEWNLRLEARTANSQRDFIGNRVGVYGINLTSLIPSTPPTGGTTAGQIIWFN